VCVAVMDGTEITALRTAGAAALSTRMLASHPLLHRVGSTAASAAPRHHRGGQPASDRLEQARHAQRARAVRERELVPASARA
jgi:hypothetical protein